MDLTLPIAFNAFSINTISRTSGGAPMSGYIVDEINLSAVNVRGFSDPRALGDGVDFSDVYLGARQAEVIVSVFGSTKGDFWDKAQDLLSHFSPTIAYATDSANLGFLPFDFYQPTADISTFPVSAYPNGIPMRVYMRPNGLPGYTSRRDDQGGISVKGLSKQFRIPLIARDPRKVLQSETTVSIAQTSSSTSSSPAAYLGDYPTTGTITIVSGSASVTASTINIDSALFVGSVGGGHRFTIPTASTTAVIDLKNRLYRLGGSTGTIRMDLFTAGTWKYPGANSTVTLVRGVSGIYACSVAYRDAFA